MLLGKLTEKRVKGRSSNGRAFMLVMSYFFTIFYGSVFGLCVTEDAAVFPLFFGFLFLIALGCFVYNYLQPYFWPLKDENASS